MVAGLGKELLSFRKRKAWDDVERLHAVLASPILQLPSRLWVCLLVCKIGITRVVGTPACWAGRG